MKKINNTTHESNTHLVQKTTCGITEKLKKTD
jgi:hypothetical protein